MALKISDLEAFSSVTVGANGVTSKFQTMGSNTGGLAEVYVTAGGGDAFRLNTNFVNGNYIDINPYITGVSNGGLEIKQNGTPRFVITAGGNIGIGITTDNGYKLNVNGGFNGSYFKGGDSGAGSVIANFVDTFGTSAMYVRGDNRVGIGTTAPQKPLEVISAANDFVSVGVNSISPGSFTGIHFGYRESNASYRKSAIVFQRTDLTANDAQGKIHILNGPQGGPGSATLADAKLTITENGNVGIGSTTTFDKLTLGGGKFYVSYAANSDIGGAIYSYNDSSYQTYAGGLRFQTFRTQGGGYFMYDAMTIDAAGRVGIGKTNPTKLLDVQGEGMFNGNISSYGSVFAYEFYNGLTYPYSTTFGSGANASTATVRAGSTSGYQTSIALQGGDVGNSILFSTASAERMRIFSNGNVFIGPSPTDAGYKFDVNGITRLNGETLINASRATVGNDGGAQKKFVTIPLNGADYQHRYILLAKAPSYGAASVNAGFRGTIVMERVNGIGIDLHDDFDFTVSYNNEIYFRQTSYQPYQTQLVRLSYGGVQYLALYVYSAPGYYVSYIDAIQTNYGGWLDANTFLAIESSTSLHSAVSYTANTTTFKQSVSVQGSVTANSGFFNSDIRLKEIVDYDYSISDIKPISYLWKDLRDNKKHVGYSAQEVQKVMPDAVNEGEDGMLSVNYVEVLVAKIAELENRIKQLEK